MIVDDIFANGQWIMSYRDGKNPRRITKLGSYYFSMIKRCSQAYQEKCSVYRGCSTNFVSFQDFANWAVEQIGYGSAGFQLDKDILVRGNRVYCKENCVFVPAELNSLLCLSTATRGAYPVGVTHNKRTNKFIASVRHKNDKIFLGIYDTPERAFESYKSAKEEIVQQQAEKWRDKIDPRAYNALMQYEVEITD